MTTPHDFQPDIALLPCPFCASKDVELWHTESNWPAVQCSDCGTLGPCTDLSSDNAIEMWNTRALSRPQCWPEGSEDDQFPQANPRGAA